MFDRLAAEEILNAATQAVSKMNFCEIEDRFFAVEGQLNPVPERAALPLDQDVRRLNGRDAFLPRFGPGWRYALFTFGDDGELNGCLVLSSADPPELSQLVRLRRVAGTAGAAQARGSNGQRPNDAIGQLLSSDAVDHRLPSLSARVLVLEEHARIRDALDQGMAPDLGDSDSREGLLAEILSQLTGRPICIEDAFGHIRAAAAIGSKLPYPRLSAAARLRTAQLWRASGTPVREPRRLVALALTHGEVLGAICMLETGGPVTPGNVFALKYATRLLEVELSHRRSLALLELRLGRDLVDELVSGMDVATARSRTTALGHDISGPQHVIVAEWQPPRTDDTVVIALRRAFQALRSPALVSRRADMAVAVVRGNPLGAEVYDSAAESLTIHRSTLRYRLKSIRQITGLDLADPETRLNLHVATRAWRLRPHASPPGFSLPAQ